MRSRCQSSRGAYAGLLTLVLAAGVFACGREPAPDPGSVAADPSLPVAPLPEWTPHRSLPLLSAEASATWRLRELAHVPDYFALVKWKDDRTLWGVAGCNPVEISLDPPEFIAWDLQACGGIAPAPDGRRIAWGNGNGGGISVGERRGEQRALREAGAPAPLGEGDAAGVMLWSPDGSRVLTAWSAEWESFFAVIDVASGETTPLETRLDGYYLTDAWGWLDDQRILFHAQAVRDLQGRSEYSESGGYRADLAVFDLRDASYRKVTTVGDGVMLRPLARWGEGEILVGERPRDGVRHERFWAYDPRDWSRRQVPLPSASGVEVFDSGRVLLLDRREAETGGPPHTRVYLWTGEGAAVEPLVEIREGSVAWSPDGRRLALTTTVDEPVPGMPGSFQTRYSAYVLEAR